jgi:hypothetical protein
LAKTLNHSNDDHDISLTRSSQVEKLFDIAYTLIDVMAVVPLDTTPYTVGPRDHLSRILWLITTLRGGETRYASLLHAKIHEALPNLAASLGLPPGSAGTSASGHVQLERVVKYEDGSTASGGSSPYDSSPAGPTGVVGGVSLNNLKVTQAPPFHGSPTVMAGPKIGQGPAAVIDTPGSRPDSPMTGMNPLTASEPDGPGYGTYNSSGRGAVF